MFTKTKKQKTQKKPPHIKQFALEKNKIKKKYLKMLSRNPNTVKTYIYVTAPFHSGKAGAGSLASHHNR